MRPQKAKDFPQVNVRGVRVPAFFAVLVNVPVWVCYEARRKKDEEGRAKNNADGTPAFDKIPLNPKNGNRAQSNNPETWGTFEEAADFYRNHRNKAAGIGIMVVEPLVGVDLDHVIDPVTGELEAAAEDVLQTLSTYTEYSRSGVGLHCFALMEEKPEDWEKKGDPKKPLQNRIEMYQTRRNPDGSARNGRFIALTLDPVEGFQNFKPEDRSAQVTAVYQKYMEREKQPEQTTGNRKQLPTSCAQTGTTFSDNEVIEILTKTKGQVFTSLFYGGFQREDESADDMTLCNLLAWVTKDYDQIERIFSMSALGQRDKWEREDYRQRTINKAISSCRSQYKPAAEYYFSVEDCKITKPGTENGYKNRDRKTQITQLVKRLEAQGYGTQEIGPMAWDFNQEQCSPPLNPVDFANMAALKPYVKEQAAFPQKQEFHDFKVLDSDFFRERFKHYKPTEFLVQDILPVFGVDILSGPPKLGKSWFAMTMCLAIATGKPFLGKETTQADILYIDTELDTDKHMERLAQIYGLLDDDLNALPGKELILPERYHSIVADPAENSVVHKIGEGFEGQVLRMLERYPGIRLIVVDMYIKIKPPKGRNTELYDSDYKAIEFIREIAFKKGIAFILVHHNNKGNFDSAQDSVSGSTGLIGATAHNYVLRKDHKTGTVCFSASGKSIRGLDLAVKFDPTTFQWANLGDFNEYVKGLREEADRRKEEEKQWKKQQADWQTFDESPITLKIIELLKQKEEGFCMTPKDLKEAICDPDDENFLYLEESPKAIANFINKNLTNFWNRAGVRISQRERSNRGYVYAFTRKSKEPIEPVNPDDEMFQ